MKRLTIYCFLLILTACSHNVSTNAEVENIDQRLQQLVEEAVYDSFEQVPGVAMSVLAPKLDIQWSGAAGFDSREKDQALSSNQAFRIASVTKTFVAAAIIRLQEKGKLSIDDPISTYLSPLHIKSLQKGQYDPSRILIRHCLHHTSGLFDYALGDRTYINKALKDPKRRWTRTEQLQIAMDTGQPLGEPGERYGYSDTGYILLGEIIETLQDTSLAAGLRALLSFDQLGLSATWLESLEPAPQGVFPMVHRYFGRDTDASEWDNSIDLYGGGGLASTTKDLAAFLYALFNGQVFEKESSLELMLSKASYGETYDTEADPRFNDYRMGLWKTSLYGQEAFMHDGFWGSTFLYVPANECAIAINYTHGYRERLLKKTALLIKNLQAAQ